MRKIIHGLLATGLAALLAGPALAQYGPTGAAATGAAGAGGARGGAGFSGAGQTGTGFSSAGNPNAQANGQAAGQTGANAGASQAQGPVGTVGNGNNAQATNTGGNVGPYGGFSSVQPPTAASSPRPFNNNVSNAVPGNANASGTGRYGGFSSVQPPAPAQGVGPNVNGTTLSQTGVTTAQPGFGGMFNGTQATTVSPFARAFGGLTAAQSFGGVSGTGLATGTTAQQATNTAAPAVGPYGGLSSVAPPSTNSAAPGTFGSQAPAAVNASQGGVQTAAGQTGTANALFGRVFGALNVGVTPTQGTATNTTGTGPYGGFSSIAPPSANTAQPGTFNNPAPAAATSPNGTGSTTGTATTPATGTATGNPGG